MPYKTGFLIEASALTRMQRILFRPKLQDFARLPTSHDRHGNRFQSAKRDITIMLDQGKGLKYKAHFGNVLVEGHIVTDYDFRDGALH